MEKLKRTRVALYLPRKKRWSGMGGADKRLSYLISHMDTQCFDVSIVLRAYGDTDRIMAFLNPYISEKCRVVIVNDNMQAFMHFFSEKYDYVLYDDFMVSTKAGILGANLAGSKTILIFVTDIYAQWSFRKKWHALLMRHNVCMANKIDTLYPSTQTSLQKRFKDKQVSVTPCSLPLLEDYLYQRKAKKKLMVFASRMVHSKNPMLLLDAMKLVADQVETAGFQVWMCGKGDVEAQVLERIEHEGLSSVVQYKGMQDMREVLPEAKVFFSLQGNENYPSQSLLEAIACGCYCIATDVGDTAVLVKELFGLRIEVTKEALAKAILHAINMTAEEYETSEESARCFAMQRFDPQHAIRHYEELCGRSTESGEQISWNAEK